MRAVFALPYYLLYEPAGSPVGSIFARRIDVDTRALVGNPIKVLEDVPHNSGNTAISASLNGTLVARVRPARSFPGAGTPIRVSPASGRYPRWRADARELFYADTSGAIVAAPIRDDGTLAGPPQTAVAASAVRAVTSNPGGVDFEP